MQPLITRLEQEIERLIQQGTVKFLSGGALGFDLLASALVAFKKERYPHIGLCYALSCREATQHWRNDQKRFLHRLMDLADAVTYVEEQHGVDCIDRQRRYLVEHADFCIYALPQSSPGIEQALRYAQERRVQLIDVTAACGVVTPEAAAPEAASDAAASDAAVVE